MNTFRSKGIFWGLMALSSIFVMAFGFRAVRNGTAMNISDIYAIAVFDAILLGLVIPGVSLLVIKEVDGWMVSSKLLAFNSRSMWWMEVKKRLLGTCFASAVIIILPVFLLANIFSGTTRTAAEWVYMLFLFLSYFVYFYLLALLISIVEIKFHQNLLAVSFAFLISFLPNILAFLFRQSGIPTISGLLNLSYAMDNGSFFWLRCGKVCMLMLLLLALLEKAGMVLLKKQDIFWK